MCLLYGVSFGFSTIGIFGIGHLFAGAPIRAASYFVAGFIWTILAGIMGLSSGLTLFLCFVPLHLLFAHFCATDALKQSRHSNE